MKFGEIKDIVREHFSRTQFPSTMLDLSLQQGRRIIEQNSNFWWMEDHADFILIPKVSEYSITDPNGDIAFPEFKDLRAFSYRRSGDKEWTPVVDVGVRTKDEIDVDYTEDSDASAPSEVVLIDEDIHILPPPDLAYEARLYLWKWTENPVSNLDSDVITSRWPMALVYASLCWGYEQILKDFQGASYWRNLLGGNPFGRGGELADLKKENFKRAWKDRVDFTPRSGPHNGYSRDRFIPRRYQYGQRG